MKFGLVLAVIISRPLDAETPEASGQHDMMGLFSFLFVGWAGMFPEDKKIILLFWVVGFLPTFRNQIR